MYRILASVDHPAARFSGLLAGLLVLLILGAGVLESAAAAELFTLQSAAEAALAADPGLKTAREEIQAAQALVQSQKTRFYPALNASYQYTRHDEERRTLGVGITRPEDEYSFAVTATQPVFTGFDLTRRYQIRSLQADAARFDFQARRQQLVFEVHRSYFSVLKARKILAVARQAVKQLQANRDVSQDFYDVGMIPLNDLLKSEVELANARQERIVAENALENAAAAFNTLLRRPLEAAVDLQDITGYTPWRQGIDACLAAAEENRPELQSAGITADIAAKSVDLARADRYPTVDVAGTYYRQGTDIWVDGGQGIYYPDGWDITATASWNFWRWGRTRADVREKLSRLSQARHQQTDLRDRILLEVKQAYLNTLQSENNIEAVEKAVAQAEENFRITEERYKEQMATTTDVLDARTLLSKTMTNYYNALYDFKIAKAALLRAMGRELLE